jgi:hypothetical protein
VSVAAVAVVSLALLAPSAQRVDVGHGLSVRVPVDWTISTTRVTPCVNPIERFHVRGDGWWIMVQEALDKQYVHRFPKRPAQFALRGRPTPLVCCQASRRPGWWLYFRDGGRSFYVAVYAGRDADRATALRVLDSLHVQPRR